MDIGGTILGKKAPPVPCCIRDSSSSGARLTLSEGNSYRWGMKATGIPDRFKLFMPAENSEVDCEVVWRSGKNFGVRFISPARLLGKAALPDTVPIAAQVIPGASRTFGKKS